MFLAAGGILIILVLVIIFSARACISSRKAAEAAALQKAQEEEAAKKAKEEAAAVKDPVSLTLSVVGDCTLGTDETFDYDTSLNACYDNNGKEVSLIPMAEKIKPLHLKHLPNMLRYSPAVPLKP